MMLFHFTFSFALKRAVSLRFVEPRLTLQTVDKSGDPSRVKCSIPQEIKLSHGYRERGFSSHFVRRRILAVVVGDDDSFSTDTWVALIMAKTASPFLRFIRLTEPVVIIEVTDPPAVLMTIFETTLSDTICSIVPGK